MGVIESHREGEYNPNVAIINMMKRLNINGNHDELIYKYSLCNNDESGINNGTYNEISDINKWFYRIKNTFNIDCTFEEFCEIYNEELSKIHFYSEVVEFAHSLKEYCKIGILSNLMLLDKSRIDKQVNLSKFDYVWLSFEVGYIKPNKKMYEIVEQDSNIIPSNILFVDDLKENLEVAKQRGWNVCQAYGYELENIKKSVNEFLIK